MVEKTTERNAWRLTPEYQLYDSFNVKDHGARIAFRAIRIRDLRADG